MNKEISPLTAVIVISVFIVPMAMLFWVSGEAAQSRMGALFLQKDHTGQLALQMDDQLLLSVDSDAQVEVNLAALGAPTLMGNVDFFSNGDIALRRGEASYGLRDYFSLFQFNGPRAERLRSEAVEGQAVREGLYRCQWAENSCQAIGDLTLPWRYRLFIDRSNDSFVISEGTSHQLQQYDVQGQLQATRSEGLKFPKRVRVHDGEWYVVDTNHHRLVFFATEADQFGRSMRQQSVVPAGEHTYRWVLDALFFADYWWVINADSGMANSRLIRFDHDWQNPKTVALPDTAEPFDMLVYQGQLLVSDIHRGLIYRFNGLGLLQDEWQIPALDRYAADLAEQRSYYERLQSSLWVILAVMLVSGFTLAIWLGRRHDRQQAAIKAEAKPVSRRGLLIRGKRMLISNIEMVPGRRVVEHLGLVQGSTVRAKHAGKDILAGLKNIFGGELNSYTELLQESRQEALDRMGEQAAAIGANGVINVRFATSAIAAGASEILAYGTAVKLEER